MILFRDWYHCLYPLSWDNLDDDDEPEEEVEFDIRKILPPMPKWMTD